MQIRTTERRFQGCDSDGHHPTFETAMNFLKLHDDDCTSSSASSCGGRAKFNWAASRLRKGLCAYAALQSLRASTQCQHSAKHSCCAQKHSTTSCLVPRNLPALPWQRMEPPSHSALTECVAPAAPPTLWLPCQMTHSTSPVPSSRFKLTRPDPAGERGSRLTIIPESSKNRTACPLR